MKITDVIWLPDIIDKLDWKHQVMSEEVDQVLFGKPKHRKVQKGHIPGENVYAALGQTEAGRYLIVFFVYKPSREALILSARDMNRQERISYGQNKHIPEMNSYEEIAEFWDTHSLADYWEQTEAAEFEISPQARKRYLVPVDLELLRRIRHLALQRGLSTESLVNLLLEQRLHDIEVKISMP